MCKQLFTFRAVWSEEDQQYIGVCDQHTLISWLSDTEEDALNGIKSLYAAESSAEVSEHENQ